MNMHVDRGGKDRILPSVKKSHGNLVTLPQLEDPVTKILYGYASVHGKLYPCQTFCCISVIVTWHSKAQNASDAADNGKIIRLCAANRTEVSYLTKAVLDRFIQYVETDS